MKSTWTFARSVTVAAGQQAVWDRVVTPDGINDEMRPWMTMSVPRGASDLSIATLEVGAPIGKAWLRLFGVLPFDYDDLSIVELEPGRRFREESTMLSMRRWVHDRTVEASGIDRSVVTDRVELTPRWWLRPAGPVLRRLMNAFFGHRHRRLAEWCARA